MNFNFNFNSVIELINTFNTEAKCIKYLEQIRWNNNVISPFDADSVVYKCKNNTYYCVNTNKKFNVKTKTLFENTKIKLQTWFLCIYLITNHKKGIASSQLAKDLNVTQKTAWFMLQRIRNCFCVETKPLNNVVEVDETYIGGKNKNRHADKKVENSQGRSCKDKVPVLGMVERGGDVIAKVVPNVKSATLLEEIKNCISRAASVNTDEYKGYNEVRVFFIKHAVKEYVNGKTHTNTIEGFWSLLKRGIVGVYHKLTYKHLQKYLDEFCFRYNTKDYAEQKRFSCFFRNMSCRLRYKELICNG